MYKPKDLILFEKHERILVQYFNPRLLEGTTVAEGIFEVENEWIKIDSISSFEGEANNIFIITSEFSGDIIIDHAAVISDLIFQECITKINI